MKTFSNNRRKIYSSNNRRANGGPRGSSESPYLSQKVNGNNSFRRSNKNFKDQYADYINKAKEAIGNGDEVLEQFYLQYAEHCFRQMEDSGKNFISKKIDKPSSEDESISNSNNEEGDKAIKIKPKSDFDDLASQLS